MLWFQGDQFLHEIKHYKTCMIVFTLFRILSGILPTNQHDTWMLITFRVWAWVTTMGSLPPLGTASLCREWCQPCTTPALIASLSSLVGCMCAQNCVDMFVFVITFFYSNDRKGHCKKCTKGHINSLICQCVMEMVTEIVISCKTSDCWFSFLWQNTWIPRLTNLHS